MIEILIISLLVLPLIVSLWLSLDKNTERSRWITTAFACFSALTATALWYISKPGARVEFTTNFGSNIDSILSLRLDDLSAPLPLFASLLWMITVIVTPRMMLNRPGLIRGAIAHFLTCLAFLTDSWTIILFVWVAATLVYELANRSQMGTDDSSLAQFTSVKERKKIFGFSRYLWASVISLFAGYFFLRLSSSPATNFEGARSLALFFMLLALMIRKGLFPFHAWIPSAFERGRLGPAILFSGPQLGTYVLAVALLPQLTPQELSWLAMLAMFTAVYAVSIALITSSARRALGYLFVSQSAIVVAGFDGRSELALAGALILWPASSIAFAALARIVLVLQARRGPLDLRKNYGGFQSKPVLATSFLIIGLSITGFPGTLGYVAQESLLAGATQSFPTLGYSIVLVSAITGIAILRMYFSLFCGPDEGRTHFFARKRERFGFSFIVTLLLITGMSPETIVNSRSRAAAELNHLAQDSNSHAIHQKPARESAH